MSDIARMNPLLSWLVDMLSFAVNEEIKIPTNFYNQVANIKKVLISDVSGFVNTMLDFSINAAIVDYMIETSNQELNSIIEYWLKNINIHLLGKVPIGVKSLSKEYYRERWKNSSLIVLRSIWEDVDINGTTFYLPIKMWFVEGLNIKIENEDKDTRIIGTEKYLLKITDKITKELPVAKNEKIFIQKPFNSWTDLYPTPFLIQRGIWKNLMVYDSINKRGEIIVGKALEYLLMLKKGSEQLAMKGDPDFVYSPEEMKEIKANFKKMIKDSKNEAGTPTYVTNFDTQLEHIIPEYAKILSSALYENVEKRLLAGLGLIDIVEGTGGSSRRESILNPKPFITEVENGVNDFITLLSDVITTIKIENSKKHPKYMNEDITLHHPPIKQFITDSLRDHFRSAYDRGLLSKRTYTEVIGDFDIDIEIKRRNFETEEGLEKTMYPPIITNQEDRGLDTIKNKDVIPPDKLGPEAKNYKSSFSIQEIEPYDGTETEFVEALQEFSKIYEEAPYQTNKDLPTSVKKYSKEAQNVFREAFNNALKYYKDEIKAFKVAWKILKQIINKEKK
jgi:cation transport regulator